VKKPSTHNSIITEIAPLEQVPIEALKPTARNARNHSKQQIRLIARSIETFGFVVPIVVDSSNEIICGNAVYLAAQLLGLDQPRVSELIRNLEEQLGVRLVERTTRSFVKGSSPPPPPPPLRRSIVMEHLLYSTARLLFCES
jgi:hypothetical protein